MIVVIGIGTTDCCYTEEVLEWAKAYIVFFGHCQPPIPTQQHPPTTNTPQKHSRCQAENYHKAGCVDNKRRYKCKECGCYYAVSRKSTKKPDEVKRMAIHMYLEGMGFRAIGQVLNISYAAVYKWVKELGEKTSLLVSDTSVAVMELDETRSYVKSKKLCVHMDCY